MHYYNVCPTSADDSIVSAWDSQLRRIKTPWIEQLLAEHGPELFQRFASCYADLRALPRGARRAVQRRLAEPDNVGEVSTEWRRRLACTVAGAALLVALGQTLSEAKGVKATTIKLSTKCTFEHALQAIYLANTNVYGYSYTYYGCKASPGPATIVMPKTPVNAGYGGTIISPVTIQGAKAKKPKKGQPVLLGTGGTISGSGAPIFSVYDGGQLTLQNVTLNGSYANGFGGAIYVYSGGSVSTFDSVISGNAQKGGAIFNYGTVTLNHSNVTNSNAYYGGGIYNAGSLTVMNNSTISGNTAGYSGGGVYNAYNVTITNSTISGNTATTRNGGGIANNESGSLSIISSTITNSTAYKGGALHNGNSLTVTGSTISDSTANYGGGLFNDIGGNATLNGTTISGNTAELTLLTNYGGKGGGIYNVGGTILNTSTVYGNKAEGTTVKHYAYDNTYLGSTPYGGLGGGIYNGSYVYLKSSSITTNDAHFKGGGVYNVAPPTGDFQTYQSSVTGNTIAGDGLSPAANVYP